MIIFIFWKYSDGQGKIPNELQKMPESQIQGIWKKDGEAITCLAWPDNQIEAKLNYQT